MLPGVKGGLNLRSSKPSSVTLIQTFIHAGTEDNKDESYYRLCKREKEATFGKLTIERG